MKQMGSLLARLSAALICLAWATAGLAQESFLGLFLQGKKIGYASSVAKPLELGGEKLTQVESRTVINTGLLGQALTVTITSLTVTDAKGSPRLMKFEMNSGGRSQKTEANFTATDIRLAVDNNGERTTKVLNLPKDGRIVDDAMMALVAEGVPEGSMRSFYVLDPMTLTLVKNQVTLKGPVRVSVRGREVEARLVEVAEPRAKMSVYLDGKGEVVKVDGPMGIEMVPMSRDEALAEAPETEGPGTDLAELSRIRPDRPLAPTSELSRLRLEIAGVDLSALPSDAHQTLRREGTQWIMSIHPPAFEPSSGSTLSQAARLQPQWIKPGLHIPSQSAEFRTLARQIIGGETRTLAAAERVNRHVQSIMRPNAGIGVLRDATEVLRTREGVCRDYAILTTTLMRAGGIPSRVVSGLVYQDGAFYYHAWSEAFDGKRWIGFDPTRPDGRVRPGHLKLAHGSVEDAFMFTFLDQAKIRVLDQVRRAAAGGRN